MKKMIILLTMSISAMALGQSQTKKVLFLGNSYTEVNNLPQIIANAAASVGDVLIFDSYTPGGYTLLQHSTDPVAQNKIMIGGWDHIVLQAQSQEPVTNESNFAQGGENLNNLIHQYNPCAVPMLYVTWGRKNGDVNNCPNIPVLCTYESMDTALKTAYLSLATYLQTEVSPVSVVWKYLRQNHPGIELYQTDESHPSAAGSYAAACCFYATIFKKDPALISFNYNLSPDVATIIRNAAKVNVFDNLSLWDFKQMPIANFNYRIGEGNNVVEFENTMQNADNYLWDFGDGTTSSTTVNPTHSYANNGTYTVTLTTSNCDLEGVHQSIHSKNISFCSHTPTILPEPLTLCPQSSEMLSTEAADSYQWYENGVAIPGATNQYFLARPYTTVRPSVMTTINGCSELSKQSYIDVHHWQFYLLTYSVSAEGPVFDANKVCIGDNIALLLTVDSDHLTQWYKNDVPIPLANDDTLVVTESGTYKARITHPMCPDMSVFSDSGWGNPVQYEFIDCSLGNGDFTKELTVSPNPAKNILNLQLQDIISEVLIYDMLGKKEIIKSVSNNAIDVSSLAQGIYLIKVTVNNGRTFSSKFIKE